MMKQYQIQETMNIRKAIKSDHPGLSKIQVDSYQTTYGDILPTEYLNIFNYEEQERDWRELLSSGLKDVIYVAATSLDEIIGYALGKPNSDEILPYECEMVCNPRSP